MGLFRKLFSKKERRHFYSVLTKVVDLKSAKEFDFEGLLLNAIEGAEDLTGLKADAHFLNYSSKSYKSIRGLKSGFQKYDAIVYAYSSFDAYQSHCYLTVINPLLNFEKEAEKPEHHVVELSIQINKEFSSIDDFQSLLEQLIDKFHLTMDLPKNFHRINMMARAN